MNKIFKLGSVIITGIVLANCGGGGGGGVVNGVTLPECSIGAADYSGCWVSELCATNTGGASARLLTEVIEVATVPNNMGTINSYLLEYNDTQCGGDPSGILHLNAASAGNFIETYVQQLNTVCSETGGTSGIPCEALDISIASGTLDTTGFTTVLITSGTRLCMPTLDYNFDDTGSGGLQAQSTGARDDILNIVAGSCAVRF
ncbi:MAG: hypothetical protein QM504_04265 [Pseudomonadota bacterium]